MVRKTVTLVFCDVEDSTPLGEQLDPETLREVWSRYHATAQEVLERHGGTIEKFIGDAVMAAFGIPVVHEDDAVRAVRAAVELREALTALNAELQHAYGVQIGVRTGINTGEVVAGDPAQGQAFATGDAVNVAQRLEAAAGGGEILIGDSTYRLVRDAVTAESLPPLELKGKSEPVAAWRLLEVEPGAAGLTRRLDSPLVGRTAELARLGVELGRAKAERSCRVVAILGEPGVGKSRLAAELIASLGGQAQVLEGRCLPYGNGITYWPLVEIVASLDLDEVLAAEPDGEAIRGRILEALGRAEQRSRSDEIYWAVRRLLETVARERPVVVVLDDIQWAEPAFLDLVEYLTGWSRDAPILICCLARTEFAELRPAWPLIPLEPLSSADTAALLENLAGPLDPVTTRQLGQATGGNPLFLGEMLRMLVEDGALVERDGRLEAFSETDLLRVPETVQAVLAARLDRLETDELAVLQRAAVIGQVFWWGAVADLSPETSRPDVSRHLQALVRKGLIRPDARTFVGEDGFRFGHILIRDAAYDSTSKRLRAELHERFADWGEERVGDSVEFDEIIGHHLEQAHLNRVELAPAGPAGSVAARAAQRLARAGRRALTRGDASAATGLLGRAAALEPTAAPLVDLAEAYTRLGSIDEAEAQYRIALDAAVASGDRKSEICARLELEMIALFRGVGSVDEVAASVQRALPVFEEVGDDHTIASLLTALADAFWWRGQTVQMQQTLERTLVHARHAADERLEGDTAVRLGFAAVVGPLPIPEGRRLVGDAIEQAVDDTSAKGTLLMIAAMLAALDDSLEDARDLAERGTAILEALGRSMVLAALSTWTSAVDLLAGDHKAAERHLRAALDELNEAGQRANVASVAAQLAEALIASGRPDEAASFIEVSRDAAAPDDLHAQIAWRVAQAKVLAAGGLGREAVRVAREALELAETTDSPLFAADSLEALAIALATAGEEAGAAAAVADALQLHESKGNRLGAERVRTLRAAARTASTPG